ncbi:2-methylcitrate dehydratase PrpD [Trichoderma compactum]
MTHTAAATPSDVPSDPSSPTGQLCTWISSLTYNDIPENLRIRAKYLTLDGLACGLIGAHLPWSEKATQALMELELTEGSAGVIGHGRRINALNSCLLNSSFIQGFELDDWHTGAPLHSNSIILPALLAASDHLSLKPASYSASGKDFIVSYIAGLEVGPRVGLALHGPHMLSMGWHSGAVFGPPASAAAAGGLMSAQFESEVKRMQHGFAARNGLLGGILAQTGYMGIKRVFEREYGGFLKQFTSGNSLEPQYKVDEIAKGLGQGWLMKGVAIKPYASMAGTHNTVDCLTDLRQLYPELMNDLSGIDKILIELSKPAFVHGGWDTKRPLTATGAQMSNTYVAAAYIVDSAVLPAQFSAQAIERDVVWELVNKTTCELNDDFDKMRTRVSVWFKERSEPIIADRQLAKSVRPLLSNDEILEKWKNITANVIDDEQRQKIEDVVLNLEGCNDLGVLSRLLMGKTANPIG